MVLHEGKELKQVIGHVLNFKVRNTHPKNHHLGNAKKT